jgi:hypothetical protein
MEYLMTYGWSILVVAVVLGALAYLGIFNPLYFTPKANPGSCQVFRPNGAGTSYDINLLGVCNGEIPEFVASFSTSDGSTVNTNTGKLLSGSTAFTISFWVNPTTLSTSQLGFLDEECLIGVKFDQPDTIEVDFGSSCWTVGTHSSFSSIKANQWIFVATTWKSGSSVIDYVDGVGQQAAGPTSAVLGTVGGNFEIGQAISGSPTTAMTGEISNVQVYNSSLGPNTISAMYAEGIGGAPIDLKNLAAWYPLNGNANDYSGNGNNGVPTNVVYTSSWISNYNPP